MTIISAEEARAWGDHVKLDLASLDTELEASVASQVLARVANVYDVSSWLTPETTPSLVRKITAMMYTGWYINRTYSEEEPNSDYALMLIGQAERLLDGIVDGSLDLPEVEAPMLSTGQPSGYPTDADCGPVFTMGRIF